jgi:hypothetical protein
VSVATGICLYECVRQRGEAPPAPGGAAPPGGFLVE